MISETTKVNFSLEGLRRLGKFKLFYKNNQTNTTWNQWKDYDDCNENEKKEANLRSILPQEVVLDLEESNRLDEIKILLKAYKYKYYIYSTGSRGFHINLFFNDLEKLEKNVRKEYRREIIKRFKCDETKSSEDGLLAIENRKHFKTDNNKVLVEKKEGWNKLNSSLVGFAVTKLDREKIKVRQSENSFIDYHFKDEFFNYIKTHKIPEGMLRDMVVFKNLAIAFVKEGLSDEEIEKVLKPIIDNNFPGKNYNEFNGWLKKAKRNEIDYYNVGELNKWGRDFLGIVFYTEDIYNISIGSLNEEESEYKLDEAILTHSSKEDLAKQFIKIQPLYYDKNKIWYIWNKRNNFWKIIDDVDILNFLRNNTKMPLNLPKQAEWYEHLRALMLEARENIPKPTKPTWVQFKNKIVDIETLKEFLPSHKYFHANPIPWKLGEKEDTPTIDKIFKEWVVSKNQDDSWVTTLYEIVAYCMLPSMPLHRIICLLGRSGLNGKGTFMRFLEKFIGEDNVTSTDLEILSRNNFEASSLYKKSIVFIGEIDKSIFSKTSALKRITGDDTVRIEFKGKNKFDAHLYAKPIIAGNELPETTDKSGGFYRRWLIVDFINQFDEKINILDTIPKEEFENLGRKCIKILKDLLKRGKFTNEGNIADRQQRYEERSNPLVKFVSEYCDLDKQEFILFEEFHSKFIEFLKSESYRLQSSIEVAKGLKAQGFTKQEKTYTNSLGLSINGMVYWGIKWKN